MRFPTQTINRLGRLFPHHGWSHALVALVLSLLSSATVVGFALLTSNVSVAGWLWIVVPGLFFLAGALVRDWQKGAPPACSWWWWPLLPVLVSLGVQTMAVVTYTATDSHLLAAFVYGLSPGPAFYGGREWRDWLAKGSFDHRGFWWPIAAAALVFCFAVLEVFANVV